MERSLVRAGENDSEDQFAYKSGPLVTFALFAYNNERFIREAVRGALAQTYSPLQVILSDDCSDDNTFSLMEEMAGEYDGPHTIVLNRNPANLGIGGHVNRIMEIARGELIVVAAGDDVSLPHRAEVLVGRWLESQGRAVSLYSKSIVIDGDGNCLGEVETCLEPGSLLQKALRRMNGVQGNSHAWSRAVFEKFGDLLPGTVFEDRVIPFRSEMLGGVEYVDEPLVKYRVHENNISMRNDIADERIADVSADIIERRINVIENYVKDLNIARNIHLVSLSESISVQRRLIGELGRMRDKVRFLRGGGLVRISLILRNIFFDPKQSVYWFIMMVLPGFYRKYKKRNLGSRHLLKRAGTS